MTAARALRAAVFSLAVAAGCATPVPGTRETPNRASPGLGIDFFARQSVVARTGDEERSFEIALQSRCGELRVVALTGFGVRLFSAVKDADGLAVETMGGRPLPFAPERVLRDVERTFFHSAPPEATAPGQLVERVTSFGGETVVERWRDGQLESREVPLADRPDDPPLEIHYGGAWRPPGIADQVRLSNPAFGYDLEIRNHHVEALPCPPSRGTP